MSFLQGLFGPPNVEKLKAEGNVNGLVKALNYQKDATIRQTATKALLEIGYAREAAEALDNMEGQQVEALLLVVLEDKDSYARDVAVQALAKRGWQPGKDKIAAIYWITKHQWDRCVEIGTPAVEPLITALKDKDSTVCENAAKALGKIGDARAVEPLSDTLKDKRFNKAIESIRVRRSAVEALGQIGDARAIEPLSDVLREGDSDAARALGQIGDARAVEPLIDALSYRPESPGSEFGAVAVRENAAKALGQIGDARAVEPLSNALKNDCESSSVRKYVAEALGQIGDARAIEPLSAALIDEDATVREYVTKSLKRLGVLHLDPGLEEEVKREVKRKTIQKKQRSDIQFHYSYSSLKEALFELRQYYMPNILPRSERSIKSDSLYSYHLGMKGHWHAFEGSLDEAYAHLSNHLTKDHPDNLFDYSIRSNGRGQLNVVANTASTGYQHFVWKTLENKYILMLSDGTTS
jgi:HEAT repeat protein